jgi:hypothetical protein
VGTLTIAGRTFTVTQSGVSFSYLYLRAGAAAATVLPGGSVSLADANLGSFSQVQFFVTNLSGASIRVSTITVSGGAFRLARLPSLPVTLNAAQPGVQFDFDIQFWPASAGSASGTLTIDGQSFQLTGNGRMAAVGAVSIAGLTDIMAPAQQPAASVQLASAYAADLTGTLTLAFGPDAVNPSDDPSVQFSGGGRTVSFTIPANRTTAVFASSTANGFSTGTVAGTITLTVSLRVAGTDVTPSPAPSRVIRINRLAPAVRSANIRNRTAGGFEVEIAGYSTPRDLTQATFRFAGSNLQTTELTASLSTLATTWYRNTASAAFGGSFKYVQAFTISQGSANDITSVTVALTNSAGSSQAVAANF